MKIEPTPKKSKFLFRGVVESKISQVNRSDGNSKLQIEIEAEMTEAHTGDVFQELHAWGRHGSI